jgi:hypothetical protein
MAGYLLTPLVLVAAFFAAGDWALSAPASSSSPALSAAVSDTGARGSAPQRRQLCCQRLVDAVHSLLLLGYARVAPIALGPAPLGTHLRRFAEAVRLSLWWPPLRRALRDFFDAPDLALHWARRPLLLTAALFCGTALIASRCIRTAELGFSPGDARSVLEVPGFGSASHSSEIRFAGGASWADTGNSVFAFGISAFGLPAAAVVMLVGRALVSTAC